MRQRVGINYLVLLVDEVSTKYAEVFRRNGPLVSGVDILQDSWPRKDEILRTLASEAWA